jgi:hypothetical protein
MAGRRTCAHVNKNVSDIAAVVMERRSFIVYTWLVKSINIRAATEKRKQP